MLISFSDLFYEITLRNKVLVNKSNLSLFNTCVRDTHTEESFPTRNSLNIFIFHSNQKVEGIFQTL